VFIDDKDPATGSVVSLEAATSAARMEPRLRERRIAVKRSVGRKRLKWLAIGLGAVAVVIAALAVAGSSLFEIKDISVEGAVYSRGDRLDAVIAELDGANVLRVDTDEIERRLEAIPWVADARVTTDFPDGATVEVAERTPVIAYQGTDGQYRVLDEHGRVLAVLAGQPVAYLVLDTPTGEGPNLDAGAFAPPGYQSAARLVPALDDGLRPQVSAISAAADGSDLRLTLNGVVEVRFGAAENLRDKLVRLQTALTDTDPENVPTELIDVSTRDIVVR
jgi:cell division septal protein FtsQ